LIPPHHCIIDILSTYLYLAATNLVEELWANALNMAEGLDNLDDLRKAGASMSVAISAIVTAAMNHRGKEVEKRLPPFVDLFMAAAAASPPAPHLSSEELKQGALLVAKELHGLADDFPKVGVKRGIRDLNSSSK
jgi:hypothetical protein